MYTAANVFSKIISFILAVLFIVVGLIFFFKYDPDAYDVKTTGVIVEIEEHWEMVGDDNEIAYTPYIDYTVGDTKYEHVEFPQYDSSMDVGDEVEFFYMSKDPTQIAGTDKAFGKYFGLGIAVIGVIMLAISVIKFFKGRAL